MRKIIFLILIAIPISMYGQVSFQYNKFIDNYWGQWKSTNLFEYVPSGYVLSGTYDDFIIYEYGNHPSKYIMKVRIYGMPNVVDKKEKKRRIKSKQWYEYRGTVEFFTDTHYTSTREVVSRWPYVSSATDSNTKLNTKTATIKIQPYKKKPLVYNIFFEGFGIGIKLN